MSAHWMPILGPAWGVSEMILAWKTRAKTKGASKDRGSFAAIWIVSLASVAVGVFVAYQGIGWKFPARKIFYEVGLAVFVVGVVFRGYAILYLGRFFTPNVTIVEQHRLIQGGPYRFIRHPTYAGTLLAFLGIALSLGNAASLIIIVVPIVAVLWWRMRIEEAALKEAFGDQYRVYMQRTKRLVPFIY